MIIDRTELGYYHLISRCVRQAFLCGREFEHRKAWLEERVRRLASLFAIDVCKFSVLSNHYHLIARNQPEAAAEWDSSEVRKRWKALFPGSSLLSSADTGNAAHGIQGDDGRTEVLRSRLCDLSWFMRALNEYIARRANREDGRRGRFWEGRFQSIRLLDEEALIQCSVYIDLNEVRAGVADTPETSTCSSVYSRILVKRMHEKRRGERSKATSVDHLIAHAQEYEPRSTDAHASFRSNEAGIWLVPIERAPASVPQPSTAAAARRRGLFDMTLEQYLKLVDAFGRIVREGKGAIAANLKPILERMRVDVTHLTTFVTRIRNLYGTVAGSPRLVKKEARRRNQSRVRSVTSSLR
jgi:REP element-mobilizing transposase RayT